MKTILPLITCLVLAGCASFPKPDFSAWKPAGPVTTVIAAWEPAVSNGEKPMRGFGGRIYFYDQEMKRPVKVKGTVIVYAFDEEGRAFNDAKPNEGFVFDNKTLNNKGIYKKSKIGHSYNLWIPWDAAGSEGKAKHISLIVRYIPAKGSSVISSQATAFLPGKPAPQAPPKMATPANWQENRAIQQTHGVQPAPENRTAELNPGQLQGLQSFNIR